MKTKIYALVIMLFVGMTTTTVKAEDDSEKGVSIEVGADLVSSYVWRGQYCAGASLQPYVSASVAGLTLGAWGSTDFTGTSKEFDLSLSYGIAGFSVCITDYFGPYATWNGKATDGVAMVDYFKTGHALEGTVGYDFSDLGFGLSVAWNTVFLGDEDYSSYIDLGYAFDVKSVGCAVGVGIAPWGGWYSDGFHVANVSFTATKEIALTDNYSLGIFGQAVWSPSNNDAHLVVGVSF